MFFVANSRTSASPVRKVQARFRQKLLHSVSSLNSINSLLLLVLTLAFLQAGFVTVFVIAAWLRSDKVTFRNCKMLLSFVAVTSS